MNGAISCLKQRIKNMWFQTSKWENDFQERNLQWVVLVLNTQVTKNYIRQRMENILQFEESATNKLHQFALDY